MTYCAACNSNVADERLAQCERCGAPRPAAGWPIDRRLQTTVAGHQYRVLRRLGTGGFGTVYEVETMVGGLRRALKVLHAEHARDESTRQRFVNEAVVLEQLSHPNVARCYAAGALDGGHELYLLLELVGGPSLAELVAPGGGPPQPLDSLRAVRLAKQIASGLVAVHANGVLHRDLTPRNVLVVGAGTSDERVKLVDFGIAGALDAATISVHTVLGTPRFMAPEQLQPGVELDTRCDLWQLGALVHLMLTGVPPSPEAPPIATPHAGLERLVRRLLAPDRDERPRSAAEVCDALARLEHEMLALDHADDALALLEALCAKPGEQAWSAICRFLLSRDSAPDLVAHASRLVEAWPDVLRRAPLAWWQAVRRDGTHPLWTLGRSLDLSGQALDDEDVRALASHPALATIACLELRDNQIGNAGAAALAASPFLRQLRLLDLSDNRLTADGAAVFPGSLRGLETLRLARNGLGACGADAVGRADWSLRELDLAANDLGTRGAEALAASPALRGLERLLLADNGIGSDGASAIALSRTLTRLVELDLSSNRIGAGGAAALALSTNVSTLASLSLARNALGLEGVELLLSSHRFGALETLDLASNDIGPQGAMALAASPTARRLKRLELADNRLGDAGLAALLGAPFLSGLRALGIAQNGITAGGVALLGGALPETEMLDLSRNPLHREGLAGLISRLPRSRLVRLLVADCDLPEDAVVSILSAAPPTLRHLDVSGTALGGGPALAPALSRGSGAISELDASRCGLDAGGLVALLGLTPLGSLVGLTADSNPVGDERGPEVAAALARLPSLVRLSLRDAGLGASTLAAIAAVPAAGRLHDLDLGVNGLDDAAAAVLARPGFHALRRLTLDRNAISFASASSILASPALPLLQSVSFARNALKRVVDLHSLARRKVDLLEATFAQAAADGARLAERFYDRLFERFPAVKPLFAHTPMRQQQRHLISALAMVMDHLRAPDVVASALVALAERHVGYGVYPSHYQAVVTTMIDTLREILGSEWTPEVDEAWHEGLEAVASTMIRAHQRGPAAAPVVGPMVVAASGRTGAPQMPPDLTPCYEKR